MVQRTLESTPKNATHWSTRATAKEMGLSQSRVSRIWRAFGLQPHRSETSKLSTDPYFIDKIHVVVGPCLEPPEQGLVFCVDETCHTYWVVLAEPGGAVVRRADQQAESVQGLEKDVRACIAAWNTDLRPYVWTKTADEILERLAGYPTRIPDLEDQSDEVGRR